MKTLHTLRTLVPALATTGLLAWGCAATDDVVATGDPNFDSGVGGAAGGGGAAGAGGGSGNSGGSDAGIDVNVSDAPVTETCEAAAKAGSTYGCEYFALQVDTINDPNGGYGLPGACYAVFVANRGLGPVKIEVDRAGQQFTNTDFIRIPEGQGKNINYAPYDAVNGLKPNDVAILFLSEGNPPKNMNCPVPTAVKADTAVHGSGTGTAFHIKTSAPVSAYQIFPYGGGAVAATSASLLIPTSGWDGNYVAINAYKQSTVSPKYAMPSLDIVAQEDDTTVKIKPTVAIEAGVNVGATAAGQVAEFKLKRGEYVQFTQGGELTGSAIQADKPIGVFGGATCINVPVDKDACDTAQQQLLPVKQLGHEYVSVRYKARRLGFDPVDESVPWRIVGAVDGTTLSYEPAVPSGAPLTLKQGEVAEFWTKDAFVVKSQDASHPFYVGAYMTGGNAFLGEGDPEWVNVVPTGQYLDSYVFFTDPSYPETSLVVVRQKDTGGAFQDVELECMGVLSDWKPLGSYEYTRVTLVTGQFQDQGKCSNGRQSMKSKAPFTATVWGWGSVTFGPTDVYTAYVSYAYPAGMGTKLINTVEIPVVK
ncbi:MAG: IgGFc-binding protein [Myxococcales bacterium]|nr:IgGFc-binding protein [Myxococcales bacterium]